MTQEHPITPPPELVQQWINEENGVFAEHIAIQAARWGADMELKACCAAEHTVYGKGKADWLRSWRRPKPPSLKERAEAELNRLIALIPTEGALAMAEPIRRALEALPD